MCRRGQKHSVPKTTKILLIDTAEVVLSSHTQQKAPPNIREVYRGGTGWHPRAAGVRLRSANTHTWCMRIRATLPLCLGLLASICIYYIRYVPLHHVASSDKE